METVNRLVRDTPIPRMAKVRQRFNDTEIPDVSEEVREQIRESGVLSSISERDQVALAVGSRGVADLPILVREVARAVKSAGGVPFVVPAMGSHGGATAEGQIKVLEQLGVTEEFVGSPIKSSMDVVEVGSLPNGLPIFTDKNAYQADKVIVINRIKPHTAFRGPIESGLMKMITIGLGKQRGAEAAHSYGFKYMADHVPEMAKIVMDKTPVIFGLGTIENAYDRPAKIIVVPADKMFEVEPELLLEAKRLMPRILFDTADVLVVDELGKDISGDGMDPNITGNYATPYASGGLDAKRIVVLGLTEKTHGNANGIGLADITTKRVFDSIDFAQGYANALTSTVVGTVKVPMFLQTEELAVKAAIKTCNALDLSEVRMIRIRNTLDIKDIWISESMLPETEGRDDLEMLTRPDDPDFSWLEKSYIK
ncbi:lactate racemase domain-containing protein [Halobacillus naozhouensis]|uniref:Lactate racemase domain-containing protein n=1 Tax=Halobacillus naozhouensis TaxID=554880 RepID=A0ABY8IVA9_9BACI|nr:lactate racemase domain-containing protein [Halobacillus naozhouensis]WFT74113.1 lactate racemase domain-containing protein [Halobacillus naozhouensis]